MPEKPEFKKVKIKQIGPLWQLEGDFIIYPTRSYPLKGFEVKEYAGTESFFQSIRDGVDKWWESFPNCCDSHRRFNSLEGFDKNQYEFITDQIYNSVRYFIHCMEDNIAKDDWFEIISQYYDYLNNNLGNPGWGSHIFDNAVTNFIEWAKFDDCDFNDDMKLKLLEHISPGRKEIEERKRNNGDIGELYLLFQTWLNAMPSIGEISTIKERLTGKIPMNLFLTNIKVNRYTGIAISNVKTTNQLIIDLENYSKSLLLAVDNSIKAKFLEDNETVFSLINEKRRIRQEKIFAQKKLPANEIVSEWLNMWIEYFTELKAVDTNGKLSEFIRDTNTFMHEHIKVFDLLDSNIAELRKNISLLVEEFNIQVSSKVKETSEKIISSIELKNLTEEDLNRLAESIAERIKSSNNQNVKNVASSMKKSQIGIKHKLKLSIPLFLFTRYEGEVEITAADKIPKNLKELKELLIETKK